MPVRNKRHGAVDLQQVTAERSEHAGEMVMRYEEVDEHTQELTGRSVSLAGVEFRPLQYSDLVSQKLAGNVVIPLSWRNARVLESTIGEIPIEKLVSGQAVLNSAFSSKTIGLVDGGWLPSGLALQGDMIVMPDRCTVTEMIGRFRNATNKRGQSRDFLDLFADKRVRINPLLYALEGNLRRNPTPEVVEQQIEEAYSKIRSALPLAKLVPDSESGRQAVIGLIQDSQTAMACERDFLLRIASKLHAPVSAKKLPQRWEEVLSTADACDVRRPSLVVLAALSSIAVPNGKSPAKALLKLTESSYSANVAYNALADLRSLNVFMCMLGLFPNERLLLCTGDKDLALFWAGVRASDFAWRDGYLHLTLFPVEELLPNMTPERNASIFGTRG